MRMNQAFDKLENPQGPHLPLLPRFTAEQLQELEGLFKDALAGASPEFIVVDTPTAHDITIGWDDTVIDVPTGMNAVDNVINYWPPILNWPPV